ncbi:MAG: glycoside hydrolase family 105 protein [Clostridia bacterium]
MDMLERAKTIAMRYIRDNPKTPLSFRPFYDGGIRRGGDYRYHADFNKIFPDAKMGDKAYVRCVYMAERDETIGMTITLFGGAILNVNGEETFRSDIFTERNNYLSNRVDIPMKKGENLLELIFRKTALGFGGIFGTWLGKWDYVFLRPDNPEMEGCRYRLNDGPWLPEFEEEKAELKKGEYAVFYTKTKDGEDVIIKKDNADFPPDGDYVNPFGIEGFGPWLGLYPLRENHENVMDFTHTVENTYWRFRYKDLWLRPYYGKGNFGRWSYPLGVTLYGLLRIGQLLKDESITDYVKAHVERCTETFDYALWDKENHGGAASLHNLLCSIDSLDDCGSFGALAEEAKLSLNAENTEKISDFISDYIENSQPRIENGAFFRKNQLHSFHNDTMWLDDLYMSVPFLCRRYVLTGKEKYIDDAANQFLQYKKLLYIEEERLMSHVFDFRHGLRNNVPWGRGNGWTVFSLSELLEVMSERHKNRSELEKFFSELCYGYAMRQSEDGRWHQVLNEPDSYLETSCTAMFACAFMRGWRMGLLDGSFAEKAKKAVASILTNCVDGVGNVYGVCRGSEFAFSSDYYKYDLLPRTNDTHGIGIVLLAIYEVSL